ncbi:aconitate hydratase, partial [Saccharothrix sp. MB29]|nr:aconitate hydratase [Saccharothrix sp. MB29]
KEQGLWHDPSVEPVYSESLELDLSTVVPSIAGPKRPQDRIELTAAKSAFRQALGAYVSDDVTGGEERKPGVPQNAQPHGADSPVDEASAESFPASDPPALSDGDQGGAPRVVHT